ncbi:hypothetical protein C5O19_17835 [Siphonobacter curvatus]|uniref:Uncharacterized protein n=1 Tax=Siphonobacter curvatus TaxID=2094562 RepID=A0A2S7IIS2_9BACT|nr:hypothetical protein C5O19_17835 [Siphonobacter curvatus]
MPKAYAFNPLQPKKVRYLRSTDGLLKWIQLLCTLSCQTFNCLGGLAYYPLFYNEIGFPISYLMPYFPEEWPMILFETMLYVGMIVSQISLIRTGRLTPKRIPWTLGFPLSYVLYTTVFTPSFRCFSTSTGLILLGPLLVYLLLLGLRIYSMSLGPYKS